MQTRPLRVALIGFGHVAKKHVQAIRHLGDQFQIIAVCDPDDAVLERMHSADLDVPRVKTTQALYQTQTPDLVVLTGPSGLHPQQTLEAARAGCHVVTEKPMALTRHDAEAMMCACNEAGVSLFVTQQMRTWPLMQHLKHTIATKQLGDITTCAVRLFWTRPQSYYDASAWRGTLALDGGTLLNQANHYLDLLVWCFGRPDAVFAQYRTLDRDIETDDTCIVYLQWPTMMASLHVSMLTYPRNLESAMTVLGTEGTIELGGPGCADILAWTLADGADEGELESVRLAHQEVVRLGHAPIYTQVHQSLVDDIPYQIPTQDVLDVLSVVAAANRAQHSGKLEQVEWS